VGGGVVGTVVVVTVAVPDGALAVKKLDDADAPALGVPDPVQAEVASAANKVTPLQSTAAVRLRTLARPAIQRTRMNPPMSQPPTRPRNGSSPGPAYTNRHSKKNRLGQRNGDPHGPRAASQKCARQNGEPDEQRWRAMA
jgi:hypothetical protein